MKRFLFNTLLLLLFVFFYHLPEVATKLYVERRGADLFSVLAACPNLASQECAEASLQAFDDPKFKPFVDTLTRLGWAAVALQWLSIPLFGYLFSRINAAGHSDTKRLH